MHKPKSNDELKAQIRDFADTRPDKGRDEIVSHVDELRLITDLSAEVENPDVQSLVDKYKGEYLNFLRDSSPPDHKANTTSQRVENMDSIQIRGAVEKTPEQEAIAELAVNMARQSALQDGAQLVTNFDENRIIFVDGITTPEYHDGDFLVIPSHLEANLQTITHELSHAFSTEWRGDTPANVNKHLNEDPDRNPISGFHVTYQDERPAKFWRINEGSTDLITLETLENNPQAWNIVKQRFAGSEAAKTHISKFRKDALERIKKAKRKLVELNFREQLSDESDEDYERYLSGERNVASVSSHVLRGSHIDMYLATKKSIEDSYNKFESNPEASYVLEKQLVTNLIDGLTHHKAKEDRSNFESVRAEVWADWKRAYYTQDTAFLERVDTVFGEGTLTSLDQAIRRPDFERLAADIQEKVDSMKV